MSLHAAAPDVGSVTSPAGAGIHQIPAVTLIQRITTNVGKASDFFFSLCWRADIKI